VPVETRLSPLSEIQVTARCEDAQIDCGVERDAAVCWAARGQEGHHHELSEEEVGSVHLRRRAARG